MLREAGRVTLGSVAPGRLRRLAVVGLLVGLAAGTQISPSVAGTTTTPSTTPATPMFPRVALAAASCAGRGCVAVGEEDLSEQVGLPFAERLVGDTWQQDRVPQPSRTTRRMSSLNAVSCWSASGCVAIGSFFPSCCVEKPFAERLTGSAWQVQRHAGPAGYQPTALSCPDARFCVSVGDGADRAPIEQWNGSGWVGDRTPDPNTDPNTVLESGQSMNLNAVACADRRDCVAVGNWVAPSQTRPRPLAEIYRDGTWLVRSPTAPRGLSYDLTSISCPAATECVAIGYSGPMLTPGVPLRWARPLAELWNGHEWIAQRLPGARASSMLSSVSCATPASCTAVGRLLRSPASFAEHWNGHTWTRRMILLGPQTSAQQLIGFSCATSKSCTAAVWIWPQTSPIITRSVGDRWTVLRVGDPIPSTPPHEQH